LTHLSAVFLSNSQLKNCLIINLLYNKQLRHYPFTALVNHRIVSGGLGRAKD
jgi:hypothetical protein